MRPSEIRDMECRKKGINPNITVYNIFYGKQNSKKFNFENKDVFISVCNWLLRDICPGQFIEYKKLGELQSRLFEADIYSGKCLIKNLDDSELEELITASNKDAMFEEIKRVYKKAKSL